MKPREDPARGETHRLGLGEEGVVVLVLDVLAGEEGAHGDGDAAGIEPGGDELGGNRTWTG